MEEIIKEIIENDLEDLRGLKISGKVPVDPDFLNEIIAGMLKPETGKSGSPTTEPSSAPSLPEADYRALLGKHIRKLEVSVEGEKIVLHFDIRIQ
jgi:hypothetical protein